MEFVYCVTAEYYLVYRLFATNVERHSDCCQLQTVRNHQQTANKYQLLYLFARDVERIQNC